MMSIYVYIHSIASIVGLVIPFYIFFTKKGNKLHKIVGWIFICVMLISAISSFKIEVYGHFTFIHFLSIMNIFYIVAAIYSTRKKYKNWLYYHAIFIGSCYISTIIAGGGVLIRKFLFPGNYNLGYLISVILAVPSVYFLIKLTKRWKIITK